MHMPDSRLSILEETLKGTLRPIKPPERFVHGLGKKIRVIPSHAIAQKANGLIFLMLMLVGTFSLGILGLILARLIGHKTVSRT